MDFCTNYPVLRTISIITKIFEIICILVPVVIVIKTMIELFKAMMNNDDNAIKNAITNTITKVVIGVVIFFMPTFINLLLDMINDSMNTNFSLSACMTNAKNLDYYKALYDKEQEEKAKQLEEERKKATPPATEIITHTNADLDDSGSDVGKVYVLSSDDINYLASVCQCEQGYDHNNGVAAEATLIVNKYQRANKERYPNIVSYVKNVGWWSCSNNNVKPSSQSLSVAKEVIVYGNRSMPTNVVEHDGFNNISYIIVNGRKITDPNEIRNKNNYIKGQTLIHNKNMDENDRGYYFYDFPCSKCDPFGYYA